MQEKRKKELRDIACRKKRRKKKKKKKKQQQCLFSTRRHSNRSGGHDDPTCTAACMHSPLLLMEERAHYIRRTSNTPTVSYLATLARCRHKSETESCDARSCWHQPVRIN